MSTQSSTIEHPLLELLVGHWVLRGTIARQSVVHDVQAEWVLAHHYVRIHEVARSKNSQGNPEYEAIVFVTWNSQSKQYSCGWLDILGGLTIESIGTATATDTELPFIFKNQNGEITLSNVFVYSPKTHSWEWQIDNIENGKHKEFARVRLTQS